MQTTKYKYAALTAAAFLLAGLGFESYRGWNYYHSGSHGTLAVPGSFVDLSATLPGTSGGEAPSTSTDRIDISSQLLQFTDNFNRRDMAAMSGVLAPEAVITQSQGPSMTRDQFIESGRQDLLHNPSDTMYVTLTSVEIDGDRATTKDSRKMKAGYSHDDTIYWVKRNGNWLIDEIEG